MYISRGWRRGAPPETKETDDPREAAASHGVRHSPAFRGYFDMSADVEAGVRNLFVVDSDCDSADSSE